MIRMRATYRDFRILKQVDLYFEAYNPCVSQLQAMIEWKLDATHGPIALSGRVLLGVVDCCGAFFQAFLTAGAALIRQLLLPARESSLVTTATRALHHLEPAHRLAQPSRSAVIAVSSKHLRTHYFCSGNPRAFSCAYSVRDVISHLSALRWAFALPCTSSSLSVPSSDLFVHPMHI